MSKLAILGGKPVRERYLGYGRQWVTEEDIQAVADTLRGDLITTGPKVAEFEEAIANYVGAKHAVAVSSGTAALHLAYLTMQVGSVRQFIAPVLTFAATVNAAIYCGARPLVVDIRGKTLNIDEFKVQKIVRSHGLRGSGVVVAPVDLAGMPLDKELDSLSLVVEDACHALGATRRKSKVGSGDHAQMTCFSLHPVKAITTGEGGIITTNASHWYEHLKLLRSHALEKLLPDKPTWYYEINDLGFNYRMTDFQAALGLSQLKKLDSFIARRREIADRYNKAFSQFPEIILPPYSEGHAWHLYIIQLQLDMLTTDRNQIFKALGAEGSDVNVHYVPLSLQPYYQRQFGYKKGDFPNAERYYERCITLPLYPAMTEQDVQDVIDAVEKVITYYRKR